MQDTEYLAKFFPSTGLYCVAQKRAQKGFRHFFFDDVLTAYEYAKFLDTNQGLPVYFAPASYQTSDNRKKSNASRVKSFWFDIDCGEGKPYADQKEGIRALKRFLEDTKLPVPSVINSGNGLYAIWTLVKDIDTGKWEKVAGFLKAISIAYGFKTDAGLISNQAVVLRPVGTTHRKDPTNPKAVRFVHVADDVQLLDFARKLSRAAKGRNLTLKAIGADTPVAPGLNDAFQIHQENTPSSLATICRKCNQVGLFREVAGAAPEPMWHAMIVLARKTTEGAEELIKWGDPAFERVIRDKIHSVDQYNPGPTTCAHFHGLNPEGCIGCPHLDKVKSPILLGRSVDRTNSPIRLAVVEEVTLPPPPSPFYRKDDGLYYISDATEDDSTEVVKFYDRDLHPIKLTYDETNKYEVVVMKHDVPNEGWREFSFRSAMLCDQRGFHMMLKDNQVHVVGAKEKKYMEKYVESYIKTIQASQKTTRLHSQMGWKETFPDSGEYLFVYGGNLITDTGIVPAGLSRKMPDVVRSFKSKGSLEEWVKVADILTKPGMEPFLFTLCCGFAAPLLRFSGFEGALVALVGKSGAGKTLTARLVQSIYGHPTSLMNTMVDTMNQIFSRMATFNNLPITIDELSNFDPQKLSDFVYQITQGKEKGRLNSDSEEKKNNVWNTITITSTNHSLTQKLSSLKADASAEIMRVFEIPVWKGLPKDDATQLFHIIGENYGVAGAEYLTYLVQNYDQHKDKITTLITKLDRDISALPEERFWSAVAACALYGGLIAKKLGLVKLNSSELYAWVVTHLKSMRGIKAKSVVDAITLLGRFLDEHAQNRLVVEYPLGPSGDINKVTSNVIVFQPKGSLVMRYELPQRRLFVDAQELRKWLFSKNVNIDQFRLDLERDGFLVGLSRKNLGANTKMTGMRVMTWEFDIKEGTELAMEIDRSTVIDLKTAKGIL